MLILQNARVFDGTKMLPERCSVAIDGNTIASVGKVEKPANAKVIDVNGMTLMPGLITGFRPKSGIRRFLTTASIVAGASGAPALDGHGRVIGVAVTGAERFDKVADTEDLGIIPINALDLLKR